MLAIRIGVVVAIFLALGAPARAEGESPARAPAARGPEASDSPNGFRLEPLVVPRETIVSGGPARDAIHAVDEPELVPAAQASWVRGDTPVIGVALDGQARAYPVHLMEYHQVVNDRFGRVGVAVTYDPLTDVGRAYRSEVDERPRRFGVSGLIYSSGFLLYDAETESLWSQMLGRALAGKDAGKDLSQIRTRVETMGRWLARHPETLVLARPERYRIDYRVSRFQAYWVSETVPFPVPARDDRFHPKELVLGVEKGGRSRAYVGSILTRAGGRIADEWQGAHIRIAYHGETGTFDWEIPDDVQVTGAYWFAWKAFHPETEIWREDLASSPSRPAP